MGNNIPLISLITCTLNSADDLSIMLKSVEAQRYRTFEHVFIDGFSTDNTLQVIEDYKKHNPDIKVSVYQHAPKGISDAFNWGIHHAKGKFIQFLNDDDFLFDETSLERASYYLKKYREIDWLQGNSVSKVGSRIYVVHNTPVMIFLKKHLLTLVNPYSHPNTFMRRFLFKKFGFFETDLSTAMDYERFLAIEGCVKRKVVNESFAVFVYSANSETLDPRKLHKLLWSILKSWYKQCNIPFVGRICNKKCSKRTV